MQNRGEVVSREHPQESVESPVHQQDKNSGSCCGQGRVKGLSDVYWKMWDRKAREELSDENIILKEDDGLGEGGVIMVEGRVDDSFVEDWVHEHIDQQYLPLYSRKSEEVEEDLIGRGVQDGVLWYWWPLSFSLHT